MTGISGGQHLLPLRSHRLSLTIVDHGRRHQPQTDMMMVMVVPVEEEARPLASVLPIAIVLAEVAGIMQFQKQDGKWFQLSAGPA